MLTLILGRLFLAMCVGSLHSCLILLKDTKRASLRKTPIIEIVFGDGSPAQIPAYST